MHALMRNAEQNPTLDAPATYRIKVPGQLNDGWDELGWDLTVTVEREGDGPPFTTLTGKFDQAALQGLLRRLYSLGLPLLSVNQVQDGG